MSALFPTYARWDIEPESAEGSWLISKSGKKYLDFTSGIGVLNLGHRNKSVQSAVEQQLNKFWHTSNLFKLGIQEEAAQLLVELSGLDQVFFSNSGAEANEAAIKLARKATGKNKIVSCLQSFHGRTFATMAATGQEKIRAGYGTMLESFEYIPFNDCEALQQVVDGETAAIILEIVQGEGGVHIASEEFLQAITEAAAQNGALIIVDEVQTGIGRTGKPFAYQHFSIQPDIITAAKGLGSGLPLGAMIGKKALAEYFGPGSHGSTFGGNPISAAAAKATLTELKESEILKHVKEQGDLLLEKLKVELENVAYVKDVRGLGLMIGIELTKECTPLILELQEAGLLVLSAGPNVIRLLPPLTANETEMELAVDFILKAFISEQMISNK